MKGGQMKTTHIAITALIGLTLLAGCVSTVTHYDKDGKITKVEKVTNTSRFFDGTNQKSQLVLIDGTFAKSDISVTAGESYTPGWVFTFANGKTAIVNAKDNAQFNGTADVVSKFFKGLELNKNGIKTGGDTTVVSTK